MTKDYIVVDSALIRKRLKYMISELPEVEMLGETGNSLMAVDAFEEKDPDAVILDIRMPGKNGVELLRDIKKLKLSVVVIILPKSRLRKKEERRR